MNRFVLLLLAMLLPVSNASALTLEQAVDATLKTNPDIRASKSNLDAARDVYRQAKGAYLPSLDVNAGYGRERSNNSTTSALGYDHLTLTRKESGVTITQLLYDGSSTGNTIARQSALVDSALASLADSREKISLNAIQLYLEMLRRKEVVRLASENLQHHDRTLEKMKERYESGVGTKVDVVQTEGRRAQSQSNLLQAQRDVLDAAAQFVRVVGVEPTHLSQPPAVKGLPATLAQALQIAYSNNPGLRAAESDLKAAVASHKAARGNFLPRFDLELGDSHNRDIDGSVGPNYSRSAMIRMTYNLYHGGIDKARLREAQAREVTAREKLASVRRSVKQDVTVVWNELQDITQRLDLLKEHVTSTKQVLVVYNQQLTLGKRTLLDLLDVQNELLRAEIAYTSGRYTQKLARYQVLASIGQLLGNIPHQQTATGNK